MINVESTVTIERTPHDVFAFVADQTNAPRWQEGLTQVRRVTAGPVGVGSEHDFVRRFAGRSVVSRNRFVEFQPERYVAFEIPSGWLTGRASYLVEADPSGGAVLTSTMAFRVHGLLSVLTPLLQRLLARASRRDEARLKSLLELPHD